MTHKHETNKVLPTPLHAAIKSCCMLQLFSPQHRGAYHPGPLGVLHGNAGHSSYTAVYMFHISTVAHGGCEPLCYSSKPRAPDLLQEASSNKVRPTLQWDTCKSDRLRTSSCCNKRRAVLQRYGLKQPLCTLSVAVQLHLAHQGARSANPQPGCVGANAAGVAPS
jgi:hypothetical protein